jgi:hypothetical protein
MSAEHSILEKTAIKVEKLIEKKGPKVMATREDNDIDLGEITEYR